jgi:hypothetical protein
MYRKPARPGRRGWILFVVGTVLVLAAVVAVGALARDPGPKTLGEAEAKQVLREELPYRFEFRPTAVPAGASGAFAGRAFGARGTVLGFGVSLGRGGDPVSFGPQSDLADATGGETFRVTSDVTVLIDGESRANPRIETRAQWREAIAIAAAIEDGLCRATEGGACAI